MTYIKYDCWIKNQQDFDWCNKMNGAPPAKWNGVIGPYHQVIYEQIQQNLRNTQAESCDKEEPMKVSYKGVTGILKKLERACNPYENKAGYILEITDETDGHKHVFENVDVIEIKFIGATVTLA